MDAISRAALILYSKDSTKTHILLGKGKSGLTTIGGRTKPGENKYDCMVREVKEETRGLLDYTSSKEIFMSCETLEYDKCLYAFIETDLRTLEGIANEFPKTFSNNDDCNELSALIVVNIDELIKDMVVSKLISCTICFRDMFMNVGYDRLKGNFCNYNATQMSIIVDLYVKISELPLYICLTPFKDNLPVVYGSIPSRGLFITDQYYLEEGEKRLFRFGFVPLLGSKALS
jgi:8-oxo-dGTP pyrophosphatase MutT (NUDIX family)